MFDIIGQILLGWLLADFLSGVLHWLEDDILPRGKSKWLDAHILAPNDLHHEDPMAFTKGSFLDRNWTNWLAVLPFAIILIAGFGIEIWVVTAIIGGLVANQIHYYAHRPPPPNSLIAMLQKTGFIQSRRGHAQHHKPPQNRSYCILTDWLNPVFDRFDIWGRTARLLGVKHD